MLSISSKVPRKRWVLEPLSPKPMLKLTGCGVEVSGSALLLAVVTTDSGLPQEATSSKRKTDKSKECLSKLMSDLQVRVDQSCSES
jgi:hypothetical protein